MIKGDYAQAYNNIGNSYQSLGRLDKAIMSFRKAIDISPEMFHSHYNLAGALKEKGLVDEALAEYETALRIRKNFPEALINMGNILYRDKRKIDEAIQLYKEALRQRPGFLKAYIELPLLLADIRIEQTLISFQSIKYQIYGEPFTESGKTNWVQAENAAIIDYSAVEDDPD